MTINDLTYKAFVLASLNTPRSIKRETPYSWWYLCQMLAVFTILSLADFVVFCSKTVVKNATTSNVCCRTVLWNISVRKQAINDTLQGSAERYLRCGGVANNRIKNSLLPSLPVKKKSNRSVDIWQSYEQEEGGCLMHFVRLATTLLKVEESARHN